MRYLPGILLAAALSTTMPAGAAVMFSDNFDSFAPSSRTNVTDLPGWQTVGGSVDYVHKQNPWGIQCSGGSNACIDLDGSTGNAGRFQHGAGSISFLAGQTYELSAWISGNQRNAAADNLLFGVSGAQSDVFTQTISNLGWDAQFQKYSLIFTATADFSGSIFFEHGAKQKV